METMLALSISASVMKASKLPLTGGFKYGIFSFTAFRRSPFRRYEVVMMEIAVSSSSFNRFL